MQNRPFHSDAKSITNTGTIHTAPGLHFGWDEAEDRVYHPTLPKSLTFVRGVSSPHLSFPMRAQLGVGRQALPRGQDAHSHRVGVRAGQGEFSRGPAPGPRVLLCIPPARCPPRRPALANTRDLVFIRLHFSLLIWVGFAFFFSGPLLTSRASACALTHFSVG